MTEFSRVQVVKQRGEFWMWEDRTKPWLVLNRPLPTGETPAFATWAEAMTWATDPGPSQGGR